MILGASSPLSALHQAEPEGPPSMRTMPRSPAEAATPAMTAEGPWWMMKGTVKPKWKRTESRMAASPAATSA